MRLVIDTNTLVSAFGWGGSPGTVVDAVTAGRVTLVTSPPLVAELARVLRYPKLAGVFPDPDRLVTLVEQVAAIVHPAMRLTVLADEPDNRVLEAAAVGQANAIVTGDRALRALDRFHDIPIYTAAEALPHLPAG